ncbi:SUN domain-containing protein 1-like [Opisthocomus hoazin]|uniref:SUN domain-containing protein 1-like n=1 Tax=Opisthocomus hoazin TaxID=30419 RepID=UPI003F537CB7
MAAAMMAAEQEAVKGGGRNRGGVQRVEGKLRASVEKGDCYEAHQMYRTLFLRWLRVTFVSMLRTIVAVRVHPDFEFVAQRGKETVLNGFLSPLGPQRTVCLKLYNECLLCSSYSLSALDFETENKIDPVFDSPRMLRRSLRLSAVALKKSSVAPKDTHPDSSYAGNLSFREQSSKVLKHRPSVNKKSGSARHTPRKNLSRSSIDCQSSFNSHASDASIVSSALAESRIREQREFNHFWGLDDEGDPKGSDTTLMQGNGDTETAENSTVVNGYTCRDYRMLSKRKEVLTAYSPSHVPSSRIYSRDRSQKHASRMLVLSVLTASACLLYTICNFLMVGSPQFSGSCFYVLSSKKSVSFYMSKILRLVKHTAASFASLLVQLFQMVLLKLGCELKAHSDYCGSMNVKEFYREDGHLGVNEESICDDCKGKKPLELYATDHMQSLRAKRVARTIWHTFSYAGYFMLDVLQTVGATGWLVSQKVVSLLWLAILSPGRAASGMYRLLRTGWYQLATLMSLLKVFLLKRCLPKTYKLFLFLLPLLFLLGIWFWGFDGCFSLLPSLNWIKIDRIQRTEDSLHVREPQADSLHSVQPPEGTINIFASGRESELEKQMAFLSERYHHLDEKYSKVMLLLQNLQDQVAQKSDKSKTLMLIRNMMGQHPQDVRLEQKQVQTIVNNALKLFSQDKTGMVDFALESAECHSSGSSWALLKSSSSKTKTLLGGLGGTLDFCRVKGFPGTIPRSGAQMYRTLFFTWDPAGRPAPPRPAFQRLATHPGLLPPAAPAPARNWPALLPISTSCALIGLRGSGAGTCRGGYMCRLLAISFRLASNFVSKSDLQPFLRDLELQILQKIALHMSVTSQKLTSEVVTKAVTNAGVRGITEAQVQTIVNNALKLFSQDKTGMVDFALESAGGSILSTRCSETYNTNRAVISLFGIPLWYLSQPPRAVIQPDTYPGNCWAFKGPQGYLVVQLSRKIYPTAFTLEHIPKALSPTGEISSALRSFAVYGLDNEYQEGGKLLGQYVYDQDGEPLQTFPVMEKSENAFQIVELRVFSDWGHPEYTCLYRFRVHGKLAE